MPRITVSRPPLALSSTAMSSATRIGSCSGRSSAEMLTPIVLGLAEDEPGHDQRRRAPAVLGTVVLLEREHREAVGLGVPGHLDEGLVAGRHLVGLETGLDAVETGCTHDHGPEPYWVPGRSSPVPLRALHRSLAMSVTDTARHDSLVPTEVPTPRPPRRRPRWPRSRWSPSRRLRRRRRGWAAGRVRGRRPARGRDRGALHSSARRPGTGRRSGHARRRQPGTAPDPARPDQRHAG